MAEAKAKRKPTATETVPDDVLLVRRWFNDPRYFAENCLSIRVYGRVVPFIFNRTQNLNFEELYRQVRPGIWARWILDDIEGKGRQRGGSTEEEAYLYHAWALGADFGANFVGKVLAFADDTAVELKKIFELFHESALESIEKLLHCDPYDILPRVTRPDDTDNDHTFRDGTRGCTMQFRSEKTKGQGRALTANALYITDLSEWQTYDDAIAGYAGSLSQTGNEWVKRDFTGKGPGNAAHREYQKLKRIMQADPKGRTRARFFGRNDIDYPPKHLAWQLQRMGQERFDREFPLDESAMFRGSPNARFKPEWIDAAYNREPRYLVDFMTDAEIRAKCVPVYCIDSAEGTPESDYAVIKCRCAKIGLEIMPPRHERWTPDETAMAMVPLHKRFPGLINALRKNHGHAVNSRLRTLGLGQWLYRQDVGNQDDREGLDENGLTIPFMETQLEIMLKDALINMPDEETRMELTILGKQPNGKIEAPAGFHDDLARAEMGCVVAFPQALRKHASLTEPQGGFVQNSSFADFDALTENVGG